MLYETEEQISGFIFIDSEGIAISVSVPINGQIHKHAEVY